MATAWWRTVAAAAFGERTKNLSKLNSWTTFVSQGRSFVKYTETRLYLFKRRQRRVDFGSSSSANSQQEVEEGGGLAQRLSLPFLDAAAAAACWIARHTHRDNNSRFSIMGFMWFWWWIYRRSRYLPTCPTVCDWVELLVPNFIGGKRAKNNRQKPSFTREWASERSHPSASPVWQYYHFHTIARLC